MMHRTKIKTKTKREPSSALLRSCDEHEQQYMIFCNYVVITYEMKCSCNQRATAERHGSNRNGHAALYKDSVPAL